MVKVIGLAGGEEFRIGCEGMDRELLAATGTQKARVIIVPTAADAYPVQSADHGVRYFTSLGADSRSLMVLTNRDSNDRKIVQQLEDADIIYFTGGNPEHLLDTIRDSALVEKIDQLLDTGTIVVGSSAGAMVMGSWMRKPSNSEVTRGLDIAKGVIVLPHHENRDLEETTFWINQTVPSGVIVLGIDAKSACLMTSKGWKVIGDGNVTVYLARDRSVYGPGSFISHIN